MTPQHCQYQNLCSGCDHLDLPYSKQKEMKTEAILKQLKRENAPVEFVTIQPMGLRSRLDFTLNNQKLGLYSKPLANRERELVDIQACPQLDSNLQSFYKDFRKTQLPDMKGSVRLRVGPQNQRGVWLDFANVDTKTLLDQRSWLLELQEIAFVEMGQKQKSLIRKKSGELGLGEPQLNPWFETTIASRKINLSSTVAAFTQPSLEANRVLSQRLANWFLEIKPQKVLEFGSGIGNLTFPALSSDQTRVWATDVDQLALQALEFNLKIHGLQDRVSLHAGDFRVKPPPQEKYDVLLLNPARSGVGKLLNSLLPLKPENLIYMSCYPETFFVDTQILQGEYSMENLILFDQFPQTKHVELLSFWKRIKSSSSREIRT